MIRIPTFVGISPFVAASTTALEPINIKPIFEDMPTAPTKANRTAMLRSKRNVYTSAVVTARKRRMIGAISQ